jgi:hypothetical protein
VPDELTMFALSPPTLALCPSKSIPSSPPKQTVKKILDTERKPVYPTGVHHAYDDKYLLSEIATRSGELNETL